MRPLLFSGVVIAVCLASVAAQLGSPVTADDYAQIRQLYARAASTLDSGAQAGRAYADLFTADAQVQDETGATVAGRDRLAALARGAGTKTATDRHHFVYNVRVDPGPNGLIIGQAYVMVASLNGDGQPATIAAGGKFRDELVKTADGWRIKSRRFTPAIGAIAAPPVQGR